MSPASGARTREALPRATEALLEEILMRVERGTLRGQAKIKVAVGRDRERPPGEEALPARDHRRAFLPPRAQAGADRGGGDPRRRLRPAHERPPARSGPRRA